MIGSRVEVVDYVSYDGLAERIKRDLIGKTGLVLREVVSSNGNQYFLVELDEDERWIVLMENEIKKLNEVS